MTAVVVMLVAALHGYFLVLEMFLWQTPFGMKTFGTTPEVVASSAAGTSSRSFWRAC